MDKTVSVLPDRPNFRSQSLENVHLPVTLIQL
jgi:hypothetical protein